MSHPAAVIDPDSLAPLFIVRLDIHPEPRIHLRSPACGTGGCNRLLSFPSRHGGHCPTVVGYTEKREPIYCQGRLHSEVMGRREGILVLCDSCQYTKDVPYLHMDVIRDDDRFWE